MHKMLRAGVLVVAIACTVQAGEIQNDRTSQTPDTAGEIQNDLTSQRSDIEARILLLLENLLSLF